MHTQKMRVLPVVFCDLDCLVYPQTTPGSKIRLDFDPLSTIQDECSKDYLDIALSDDVTAQPTR